MNENILKILRYNTGNDKKVFLQFKDFFDIVIINANIVVHSSSSIANLISIHKKEYVIDPQTHIFQHNPTQIISKNTGKIKESINKFLQQMPKNISESLIKNAVNADKIQSNLDQLIECVYNFQNNFIANHLAKKEYNEYLEFMGIDISPRYIIAPYFMIKDSEDFTTKSKWLDINKTCLEQTIKKYPLKNIAAQLVLEKHSLIDKNLLHQIKATYNITGYDYIFIWIDDFSSFTATLEEKKAFKELIKLFNSLNKKVVNLYGGYDSILMCHHNAPHRLYGVAQSSGYGESRKINPVGGLPNNNYYFFPLHWRMNVDNAVTILTNERYLATNENLEKKAIEYYKNICDCQQCKKIIGKNINNFGNYVDANDFTVTTKHRVFQRNRPTQDAKLNSDMHFMYCKEKEWRNINSYHFHDLVNDVATNNKQYALFDQTKIKEWVDIFGK